MVRRVRQVAIELRDGGKTVKILCVGRKGHDVLKREFSDEIIESIENIGKRHIQYDEAISISHRITELFNAGEFDVCTIIFNRFQSAMTQIITPQQLIPFEPAKTKPAKINNTEEPGAVYVFEPEEKDILESL